MQIKEIMTGKLDMVGPATTLKLAAEIMRDHDIGVLPVMEDERLIGLLTDRDIVVGPVAAGTDPAQGRVREAMSEDVYYCFDDQPVEAALSCMGEKQVRRLPILNRDMQMIGIVSLGDICASSDPRAAGETLGQISMAA